MRTTRGTAWLDLALLAARRAAPPTLWALAATVALSAATGGGASVASAGVDAQAASHLARASTWGLGLLLVAPVALLAAGGTVPRWRRGDVDWIGTAQPSRLVVFVATWLGQVLAAALALAAVAGLAEWRAGDEAPAGRVWVRSLEAPSAVLLGGDAPLEVRLDVAGGDALQLEFALAGGSAADVEVALQRGARSRAAIQRVSGRGAFELALPDGAPAADGGVTLRLRRVSGNAAVALARDGIGLLRAVDSPRIASWHLFARALVALAAGLALALAGGTWVRGATACALVLALVLGAWLRPELGTWPWSGLDLGLARTGRGLAPGGPGGALLARAALTVACGVGVGRAGLTLWRRPT